MVEKKSDPPPRPTAGWGVAAIVAVVAVCAVSFMVSQKPQQAMAVAEGDPLTAVTPRAPRAAPIPAGRGPEAIRANPPDGADTGRLAPEPYTPPRTAMDANAAGSNASAIELSH